MFIKTSDLAHLLIRNSALSEMGINFDAHLSHDIITEKPGSIQTVLYQIYVILSGADGFNKRDTTDFCSAEHSQLNAFQNLTYKHQLRQLIPRQSDVSLAQILSRFERKKQMNEKQIKKADLMDTLKKEAIVQEHWKSRLQRSYNLRIMQSELMAKLEATIINLPGHVGKKLKNESLNKEQLKQMHTNSISLKELDEFDSREENYESYNNDAFKARDKSGGQSHSNITMNNLKDYFNEATTNYMKLIHKKANEEKQAISEHQKRRRRVIMDILEAHHNRQEEIRSEQIIQRLSRQSHLESRICVQLEQIKREKSIILENRREREQQYEARIELGFQLAMDRERDMLLLKNEEEQEKLTILKQLWAGQLTKRRQASYKRHYDFIQNDIILLLLQFVMNVADYRVYTKILIPLRLFRQWKIEFIKGILPSDTSSAENQVEDPVENEIENTAYQLQLKPDQIIEEQHELLDDCDLEEYQNLTGDWDLANIGALYMKSFPNELIPRIQDKPMEWIDLKDEIRSNEFKLPNNIDQLRNNPILEWIIKRLYKINFPVN
ncbi:hypothetical protein MN116_009066, partial [Schistosoma mekongi]